MLRVWVSQQSRDASLSRESCCQRGVCVHESVCCVQKQKKFQNCFIFHSKVCVLISSPWTFFTRSFIYFRHQKSIDNMFTRTIWIVVKFWERLLFMKFRKNRNVFKFQGHFSLLWERIRPWFFISRTRSWLALFLHACVNFVNFRLCEILVCLMFSKFWPIQKIQILRLFEAWSLKVSKHDCSVFYHVKKCVSRTVVFLIFESFDARNTIFVCSFFFEFQTFDCCCNWHHIYISKVIFEI